MTELIGRYMRGDMQALYFGDRERGNAELLILPEGMEYKAKNIDVWHDHPDSIVQIKLAGDMYTGAYSPGISLRVDTKTFTFKYSGQEIRENDNETEVVTLLEDERGYKAEHHLCYTNGSKVFVSYSVFRNESTEAAELELFSSFSLGKISPFMEGDGTTRLKLHRIRSVWSMEGRKESIPFEDLQLEPSWAGHAVRCERFGATGSYAVNKFFPVMAVEDSGEHIFWGASIAHNASWQMEVYRRGTEAQISGGVADREFGHWMKKVSPGEEFRSPVSYISVCRGEDEEEIFRRLTSATETYVEAGPASEQDLPVLFNEYCTTWGNPSHENIADIVKAIKGKGFKYFVIDCGWYKRPEVPWDISMGDYEVSKELFPKGLEKTVALIKEAGMKPGIWFEIDNVGPASKVYENTDLLLKRDGRPLTTTGRRFFDLRQKDVQKYLTDKVIGTLKKYGFEYIKIDCNDTVGIGCDGAESLGEGLRQNQEASVEFIRKIKREIPDIVVENCASGGHKIEPLMMSECAMASFSDAHECPEIPVIAASLHRVILPRQSQIWAVIRKEDEPRRIAYSVANTFLGRMCISGDVWLLNDDQWKLIDEGIAFYKKIAPVIKSGKTYYFGPRPGSWRNLEGWQGIFRQSYDGKKAYAVIHGFNGMAGREISIDVPEGYRMCDVYPHKIRDGDSLNLSGGKLTYTFSEDMEAAAVHLG